ncbi:MAG: hypothetical protein WDM94_15540 [Bauldia sp.]
MADKKLEKKDAGAAAKQQPKPQGSNRDPKPAKKGEAKAIPVDKLNASNDE